MNSKVNDEFFIKRFWPKVKKTDTCWVWNAYKRNGYGQMTIKQKHYQTHRVIFEFIKGPIPKGKVLDHLCRNRSCVNPDHLRIVSHKENILCGLSKSAFNSVKTHCIRGHEFTAENTQIIRHKKGKGRRCRECKRQSMRIYYYTKRHRPGGICP